MQHRNSRDGSCRSRNNSGRDQSRYLEPSDVDEPLDEEYLSTGHNASHHRSMQSDNNNDNTYDSSHPESAHRYHYYDAPQDWYTVPRPWQESGLGVHRSTHDVAPDSSSIVPSSDSRERRIHGGYHPPTSYPPGSSSNSTHQVPSYHHHETAPRAPRPQLTSSRMDQLNDQRTPTTNMDMWMNEHQRDGPWDGVGYVRMRRDGYRRSNGN